MTKEHILAEIQRVAKEHGGEAPGSKRFLTETGIKESEWSGVYWIRWGDALIEAGFTPNQWTEAYADDFILEKYISFIRKIGRIPVNRELMLERRRNKDFPSSGVFKRLGSKRDIITRVQKYCEKSAGYEDVLKLCREVALSEEVNENEDGNTAVDKVGYVYLLQHGSRREYKIGKTFNPIRREGEIGLQLPEKLEPVHYIKTDDPSGVEAYWHARLRDKRREGEWFVLSPADVKAFKRWRSIY
jgi:hypothetical protein